MEKNLFVLALAAVAALGCGAQKTLPPGYQGVVEYEERLVAFEVGGRIDAVAVHRGDTVHVGDVLAKLDDTLEKLTVAARLGDVAISSADLTLLEAGSRKEDVAAAMAQVRSARTAEALLKSTLERVRALYAASAVTQMELDKAQSDYDRAVSERQTLEQKAAALQHGARPEELARAKARVAAAEATSKLEEERLARYVVHVTTEGSVLDVHVRAGELAAPGTPLVTVADTTHPFVDVFVPEGSLGALQIGTKATLHVDGTSEGFGGTIEFVSPRTEFTPRFLFSERERPNLVIRVRVRIDDPQHHLHSGVPAFVTFASGAAVAAK